MLWRFYVYVFRARCKTAISPSFLAAFFLLAAALWGLGVIFNQDNALSIRVGLLSPEGVAATEEGGWDAALVRRVIEGVQYYGRDDCEIILYTDEAQLRQDVSAHKLECGYAFLETGVICAYRSPMTVADKVLDLLVAAAYMETMAGTLGAETLLPYLADMNAGGTDIDITGDAAIDTTGDVPADTTGDVPADTTGDVPADITADAAADITAAIAADIQARADAYLQDGALMEIRLGDATDSDSVVQMQTSSETAASTFSTPSTPSTPSTLSMPSTLSTLSTPSAPYRRLFHGLLGLFTLLLALLCGMGLAGDTQKAALARIKATGRGGEGYQLAGFGVIFLAAGSFMALTVAVGAALYPGLSVGWRGETLMTLAYAWALAGIAAFLSAYVRVSLFPALLTFIFIFAALLGGVFFDLREIWAAVAFLRYGFPNHHYAEGISRATTGLPWQQVIGLTGVGLTTGALAVKSGRHSG